MEDEEDDDSVKPIIIKEEPIDDIDEGSGPYDETNYDSTDFIISKIKSEHENDPAAPPTCEICHKIFLTRTSLLTHKKRTHDKVSSGPVRPCETCGKPQISQDRKNHHLKTHLGRAELIKKGITHYVCYFCEDVFFLRLALEDHTHKHTLLRPYFCPTCPNKSYTTHTTLKVHILKAHTSSLSQIRTTWKYPCPICHQKFRAPSDLAIHLPRHSSQKTFRCHSCDKAFKFRPELVAHLKLHDDKCPHSCHLCDHRSTSAWKLKQHLLSHSTERTFKCDLCPAAYKQEVSLRTHVKTRHDPASQADLKPWNCTTCAKCFTTKAGLKLHSVLHNLDDSTFSCSTCGKKLADQKRLTSHEATHTGRRDFPCTWPGCGRKYTEKANLTRHLKSAHEKMMKPCPVVGCGREFTNCGGLKYHKIAEHGIGAGKPCGVSGCERSFPTTGTLKAHRTSVHGLADLEQCPIKKCFSAFTTKEGVVAHVKGKHRVDLVWDDRSKTWIEGKVKKGQGKSRK